MLRTPLLRIQPKSRIASHVPQQSVNRPKIEYSLKKDDSSSHSDYIINDIPGENWNSFDFLPQNLSVDWNMLSSRIDLHEVVKTKNVRTLKNCFSDISRGIMRERERMSVPRTGKAYVQDRIYVQVRKCLYPRQTIFMSQSWSVYVHVPERVFVSKGKCLCSRKRGRVPMRIFMSQREFVCL